MRWMKCSGHFCLYHQLFAIARRKCAGNIAMADEVKHMQFFAANGHCV